jgi:hypothetical protein
MIALLALLFRGRAGRLTRPVARTFIARDGFYHRVGAA